MNLLGWKLFPKDYRRDVVVAAIRLGLFFFAFRILLVVITSGWSTIIYKWYWELAWFIIFTVFGFVTVFSGLLIDRYTEKKARSQLTTKDPSSERD